MIFQTACFFTDFLFISFVQQDTITQQWFNQTMLVFVSNPDPTKNGTPCTFQSIIDAFWWCIVTICTIGYGDVVPDSRAGRAAAAITMIGGVFLLGFPVSIFSANFIEIYSKHKLDVEKKRVRRMTVQAMHRKMSSKPAPLPAITESTSSPKDESHHSSGIGRYVRHRFSESKILKSAFTHSVGNSPDAIRPSRLLGNSFPGLIKTDTTNPNAKPELLVTAMNRETVVPISEERQSGAELQLPGQTNESVKPITPASSLQRRSSNSSSGPAVDKDIVRQLIKQMAHYQHGIEDLRRRLDTIDEQRKLMEQLVNAIAASNSLLHE